MKSSLKKYYVDYFSIRTKSGITNKRLLQVCNRFKNVSIKCDITLHRLCRRRTTMDLELIYSDSILHGLCGGLEQFSAREGGREHVHLKSPPVGGNAFFFLAFYLCLVMFMPLGPTVSYSLFVLHLQQNQH